jgi:hypothetical protein
MELIPKHKSDVQFNGQKLDLDWVKSYSTEVGKEFNERYDKIVNLYNELMDDVYWNQFIYGLNTKFKPVIGHTYHLYQMKDESYLLSIIAPDEWKMYMKFIHSFKFEYNGKFVKI